MEIPGYRIQKELGCGGMAIVYLALQESLDRYVALKVIKPALTADEEFAQRFLREGRIIARLSNPHIVTVYDIATHGETYYLAMEYLPGDTLQQRIHAGLPLEEALSIARSIASALHYAHHLNIIHRDIKPQNILFRANGSPVLTDFGIAKTLGGDTIMTRAGLSIGTPRYMSPEQIRCQQVDNRSDLYSLGILFHEMLTGNAPYTAEDNFTLAMLHVTAQIPVLPSELSRFQPIIEKQLHKDPNQRFQTGHEFIAALDHPEKIIATTYTDIQEITLNTDTTNHFYQSGHQTACPIKHSSPSSSIQDKFTDDPNIMNSSKKKIPPSCQDPEISSLLNHEDPSNSHLAPNKKQIKWIAIAIALSTFLVFFWWFNYHYWTPQLTPDTHSTPWKPEIFLDVLSNDQSKKSNLKITNVFSSSEKNIQITPDGKMILLSPEPNFTGIINFTYTVTDTSGHSAEAQGTVIIQPQSPADSTPLPSPPNPSATISLSTPTAPTQPLPTSTLETQDTNRPQLPLTPSKPSSDFSSSEKPIKKPTQENSELFQKGINALQEGKSNEADSFLEQAVVNNPELAIIIAKILDPTIEVWDRSIKTDPIKAIRFYRLAEPTHSTEARARLSALSQWAHKKAKTGDPIARAAINLLH